MKIFLLYGFAFLAFASCNNSDVAQKDNAWWENKILETMNSEVGPEGGGANYADKVEVIKKEEKEDGSVRISFLWWGEFRNGSIAGFEPRKVKGEALIYEFDKDGKRIDDTDN